MALINHVKREINAKLIIYGPPFSGKTTSLSYIYRKLKPEYRGSLKTMNIQNDRMVFFNFFPGGKSDRSGYTIHYHLYTISGGGVADSSWRMLLKGVDGILFVVDSDAERQAANHESARLLEELLASSGVALQATPLVLQCNKRDLTGALPLEALQCARPESAPVTGATATTGEGVLEALFTLIRMVQNQLGKEGLGLKNTAEQVVTEQDQTSENISVLSSDVPFAPPEDTDTVTLPSDSDAREPVGVPQDSVELAGVPVPFPGGLRLPLVVRCGSSSTNVTVTLSLSLDQES